MQRRHDGLHPPQKSPPAQWHEDEYLNSYPGARYQPGAEDYYGIEWNDAQYPIHPRLENRGSHAGKGPKSFRRTDGQILEDVSERLWRHPKIDASEIEVEVSDGIVTLKGTVDERRMKRLAEEVCDYLPGVFDVHNEIRVNRTPIANA
jgi:hypothetical protein